MRWSVLAGPPPLDDEVVAGRPQHRDLGDLDPEQVERRRHLDLVVVLERRRVVGRSASSVTWIGPAGDLGVAVLDVLVRGGAVQGDPRVAAERRRPCGESGIDPSQSSPRSNSGSHPEMRGEPSARTVATRARPVASNRARTLPGQIGLGCFDVVPGGHGRFSRPWPPSGCIATSPGREPLRLTIGRPRGRPTRIAPDDRRHPAHRGRRRATGSARRPPLDELRAVETEVLGQAVGR